MKITLLGTGTSHGVPAIGCDCDVCRSPDPHDRRLPVGPHRHRYARRRVRRFHVLVDTSTDLRAQALAYGVRRVDAILFTHGHADHVLGLDEVRRYNAMQRASIPCYADEATLRRSAAHVHLYLRAALGGGGRHSAADAGPHRRALRAGRVEIVPVPILHGRRPILGFRLGAFAYLTDCSRIPDESWPLLAGVRVLVLDALRDRPHPTHFTVAQALEAVARIAPERAYFTHICHDLPHAVTCARLPPGVQLAYDGLVLDVA